MNNSCGPVRALGNTTVLAEAFRARMGVGGESGEGGVSMGAGSAGEGGVSRVGEGRGTCKWKRLAARKLGKLDGWGEPRRGRREGMVAEG